MRNYQKYPTRELIVLANRGNRRAFTALIARELKAAGKRPPVVTSPKQFVPISDPIRHRSPSTIRRDERRAAAAAAVEAGA